MEIVDFGNPSYDKEHECRVCGVPMEEDKDYCSHSCWQSDFR